MSITHQCNCDFCGNKMTFTFTAFGSGNKPNKIDDYEKLLIIEANRGRIYRGKYHYTPTAIGIQNVLDRHGVKWKS